MLQVVIQQRCNGRCPCDSALAQRLKQQLRSTLVAAQWRGDTALTLPLFLGRSTASSVFRVGARGQSSPHSLALRTPSPHCPPFLLSCCLTSTEARWLIRDGDRVGRGRESEGSTAEPVRKRPERPWTAARTHNGSVKAVSPRHCPATCALSNCCFNCCVTKTMSQSH